MVGVFGRRAAQLVVAGAIGHRFDRQRQTVEFSVILDPYEDTVTVSRRVFQHLLDPSPTPERCMELFYLQRTRFELIVERKLRR